jgi:Ion channel
MSLHTRVQVLELRRRYGDQLLSLLTVLLAVMLFLVAPIQAAGFVIIDAFGVFVALVLIAGAFVISANPIATTIMLAAFSVNLMVVVIRLVRPLAYDLYMVAGAWAVISTVLGFVVARQVFERGQVTFHRIIGAILLYMLIAMAFVSLFMLVGLLAPGAFSGLTLEDNQKMSSSLIYFSFATLTTTGYGDIVPVHPVARSLCNLEAVIGQLYPATLLARLVSLELAGRGRSSRESAS